MHPTPLPQLEDKHTKRKLSDTLESDTNEGTEK